MNAQQLKNAILQEAIEGRLVPQDPNDEPASALLERIRKKKEQLVKAGKLKKKDLEVKPISEDERNSGGRSSSRPNTVPSICEVKT